MKKIIFTLIRRRLLLATSTARSTDRSTDQAQKKTSRQTHQVDTPNMCFRSGHRSRRRRIVQCPSTDLNYSGHCCPFWESCHRKRQKIGNQDICLHVDSYIDVTCSVCRRIVRRPRQMTFTLLVLQFSEDPVDA